MSDSIGHICYGIPFPEEYEFLWENCGFSVWKETVQKTYKLKNNCDCEIVQKIRLITYGSHEDPKYIITLNNLSKFCTCAWDYCKLALTEFSPSPTDKQILIDFCTRFCQPINRKHKFPEMRPAVYLTSFFDD
jgi:hypothetical protein